MGARRILIPKNMILDINKDEDKLIDDKKNIVEDVINEKFSLYNDVVEEKFSVSRNKLVGDEVRKVSNLDISVRDNDAAERFFSPICVVSKIYDDESVREKCRKQFIMHLDDVFSRGTPEYDILYTFSNNSNIILGISLNPLGTSLTAPQFLVDLKKKEVSGLVINVVEDYKTLSSFDNDIVAANNDFEIIFMKEKYYIYSIYNALRLITLINIDKVKEDQKIRDAVYSFYKVLFFKKLSFSSLMASQVVLIDALIRLYCNKFIFGLADDKNYDDVEEFVKKELKTEFNKVSKQLKEMSKEVFKSSGFMDLVRKDHSMYSPIYMTSKEIVVVFLRELGTGPFFIIFSGLIDFILAAIVCSKYSELSHTKVNLNKLYVLKQSSETILGVLYQLIKNVRFTNKFNK